MAIYHYSAQIIKRTQGRSAVAAAAYRSAQKIEDLRLGETFNYSHKNGVDYSLILAPENAPEWVTNRAELWKKVELFEKRKDAQVSREFNAALPTELSRDQQISLAMIHAKRFVQLGMIADVNFHDLHSHNPHFHLQLTLRKIQDNTFSKKKNREWNSKKQLEQWRKEWAEDINKALKDAGYPIEVSEKSLIDQGIKNRLPQIHEGPFTRHMVDQDKYSERADINSAVKTSNSHITELIKIQKEIRAFKKQNRIRTLHPGHKRYAQKLTQSKPFFQNRKRQAKLNNIHKNDPGTPHQRHMRRNLTRHRSRHPSGSSHR